MADCGQPLGSPLQNGKEFVDNLSVNFILRVKLVSLKNRYQCNAIHQPTEIREHANHRSTL